jgi:hypothetical protein
LLFGSTAAQAQSWSFDARKIGLGGESSDNLATEMVDEQRPYRSIVLPFGLFQVLGDFNKFDPGNDEFDLVRTIEYASSPLHFIVGRGSTETGDAFVTDVRNGELSRDLNNYRGFVPASELRAIGLSAPSFGKTFIVRRGVEGAFHGVRVGAGPYLASRTIATIDPDLIAILDSASPVYVPNTSFFLEDQTQGQLAMAITGGYRGRIAWPVGVGGGTEREGLYLAADYNYLHGFRLEDFEMGLRVDTDGAGLVTFLPTTAPIAINRVSSTSGSGMSVDVGVAAVVGRIELGFGANGIGNRITWKDAEQTTFTLTSLVSGGEFLESPTTLVGDRRVELPVDYRGDVAYVGDVMSVMAEIGHGYQGTSFHGGIEQRLGRYDLRAGARYSNDKWNPTGGVGFNFTPRFAIDVAAFGTTANIQRKRQLAIAASIRLTRQNP